MIGLFAANERQNPDVQRDAAEPDEPGARSPLANQAVAKLRAMLLPATRF